MQRRQFIATGAGVALSASLAPFSALAQDAWPSKPVKLIVPFPPGGPTDVMGRTAAKVMSEKLGQPFVVENKAGAGGNIGTEAVAKAPADGYTIGLSAISSLAIAPHLYATSGIGTSNHLAAELLQATAGIQLTSVPYKGSSQIVPDLLSGVVMMSMESSLATTLQHIKAGKLKPIAVTSPKRSRALPNVPTIAESGYPGFEVETWFGLVAPAATPRAIVDKLQAAWSEGSKLPDAINAFDAISADIRVQTPAQFAEFMRAENTRWGDLIRKLNIKLD